MKKEIRKVTDSVVQITTSDERWYMREEVNLETRLPELRFVPSVTWIAGSYPKGIGFYKWLADKGWDEAEAIKSAAGDKGSKVHLAIVDLLDGKDVPMESKHVNNSTGQPEELSVEEYEAVAAFVRWWKEAKPTVIAREVTVWNDSVGYAGTVDLVCCVGEEVWIVDFKTSQYLWPEHELQISAYKHANLALAGEPKLAILQIGYKRNKNGYKFTEVGDKFDLFLSAHKIWANEHGQEKPRQIDLPVKLTLQEAPAAAVAAVEAEPARIKTVQKNGNKKTMDKNRSQSDPSVER